VRDLAAGFSRLLCRDADEIRQHSWRQGLNNHVSCGSFSWLTFLSEGYMRFFRRVRYVSCIFMMYGLYAKCVMSSSDIVDLESPLNQSWKTDMSDSLALNFLNYHYRVGTYFIVRDVQALLRLAQARINRLHFISVMIVCWASEQISLTGRIVTNRCLQTNTRKGMPETKTLCLKIREKFWSDRLTHYSRDVIIRWIHNTQFTVLVFKRVVATASFRTS